MGNVIKLNVTHQELDFLMSLMMTQGQQHADFLVMNDMAESSPDGRTSLNSGSELRLRLIRSAEFINRFEQTLAEKLAMFPPSSVTGPFMDDSYDYLDK